MSGPLYPFNPQSNIHPQEDHFNKHNLLENEIDFEQTSIMHITSVIAFSVGAVMATASPVPSPGNEFIYATFYNDNACTQGAGEPVNTKNPGCLNESGRQSIYFQAGFDNSDTYLVQSNDQNCPCQNGCVQLGLNSHDTEAYCLPIDLRAYNSLRFVSGTNCPANNC